VRNDWESAESIEKYCCKIIYNNNLDKSEGIVEIAFPYSNIDFHTDGISQLLCMIMGGQTDISKIKRCRIIDFNLQPLFTPKFGITDIRNFTKCYNKPLLGGIIKPKTGLTPDQLLDMTKQLVDGGVNFIKEDEILSNPKICPLYKRIEKISNYIAGKKVIYAFCINADPIDLIENVRFVHSLGGSAVHVNFWCGLGSYKSIRRMNLPLFLFYQKSGIRILTDVNNRFSISWKAICRLSIMCGIDFIHAGMWGGYSGDSETELYDVMDLLVKHNVMPSLSCGMHPGIVNRTTQKFGNDYMANVGGAIHGHPGGTLSGTTAMRQAIDGNYKKEYYEAINKWGYEI
jgi:ribulose-bisphosphate carboxylase large chain